MIDVGRFALVTDFGSGIYVGQMQLVLAALAAGIPAVDLVHDLPAGRPRLCAPLVPALARGMPENTLYLCVVDPGVGGERDVLLVVRSRDAFLAPDNGLLAHVVERDAAVRVFRLLWRPRTLSNSFHGRDVFAPAAAALATGKSLELEELDPARVAGGNDRPRRERVCYVDRFGNLISGIESPDQPEPVRVKVGTHVVPYARTFCSVDEGQAFWYPNALGLVEVAVNGGHASKALNLSVGASVELLV
jgi:S-adenosyl-L-methionine hydrolase (adenosine-forming)